MGHVVRVRRRVAAATVLDVQHAPPPRWTSNTSGPERRSETARGARDEVRGGRSQEGVVRRVRGDAVSWREKEWAGPIQSARVETTVMGRTPDGRTVTGVLEGEGVVQNPSFGYLIHTRTIAEELRTLEVTRPPASAPARDAGT